MPTARTSTARSRAAWGCALLTGSPIVEVDPLEAFQSQEKVTTPTSFWSDLVFDGQHRFPQAIHITDWYWKTGPNGERIWAPADEVDR